MVNGVATREARVSNGGIETYQAGGLWHNHVRGAARVLSSHSTKGEAEERGRRYAIELHVEHIVRSLTGRISKQDSYAVNLAGPATAPPVTL
jgi:hypothetical protein